MGFVWEMGRGKPANREGKSLTGSLFQRGQTVADGEAHQVGQVVDAQLLHDVAAIGFDGLGGEVEDGGHLGAGLALHHQLQDLLLAAGEAGEGAEAGSAGGGRWPGEASMTWSRICALR